MVEALGPHRLDVREPGVDLVDDRQRGQQLTTVAPDGLGRGEDRAEIVTGVVRLPRSQVGVHEVEGAGQRAGVERRAIRGDGPAPDEGGAADAGGTASADGGGAGVGVRAGPPEVVAQLADRDDGLGIQRSDRDPEGVEDPDLELMDGIDAEVLVPGTGDEIGELLDLGGAIEVGRARISGRAGILGRETDCAGSGHGGTLLGCDGTLRRRPGKPFHG